MPIKSFRGKIDDGNIDTISLHTNDGSTGYRIVKFQLFPVDPQQEHVNIVHVTSILEPVPTTTDFSNQTLLAAALWTQDNSTNAYPEDLTVIFDNTTFNQDIYIANNDKLSSSGQPINYYLELEVVKLDLNENTVATLKDIRNIEAEYL